MILSNFINYGLAFLEGFALIISPCILPILPIMLSASIEGGKKRPLGIILGFIFSFALFTLFARSLVQSLGIRIEIIQYFAYGFIIFFGFILIFDYLSAAFNKLTQKIASLGNVYSTSTDSGFFSGILLGLFISLIWVPCAGPILAAAIVQTAIQKTSLQSFMTFLSFALGSVIPMILIAWLGREAMLKIKFLTKHSELLRKCFGIIIILAALIALWLSFVPQINNLSKNKSSPITIYSGVNNLIAGLMNTYPAPEFPNAEWINSTPITMKSLMGKVVLIDFWTYSCINCIRTLPYLIDWYQKYHRYGFEIIGVHSPEFEFEKNIFNVKSAVMKLQIPYSVVLDNDYKIWLSYHNMYWPAHYLINKKGNVVYQHFGEGNYDEIEQNIRTLLGINENHETQQKPQKSPKEDNIQLSNDIAFTDKKYDETEETYLGYARAKNFSSIQKMVLNKDILYNYSSELKLNNWSLQGRWIVEAEKIISMDRSSTIKLKFYAKKVYAVMGSRNNKSINIKVYLNNDKNTERTVAIKDFGLYEIVNLQNQSINTVELIPDEPGLEIYTFTFGM